MTREMNVRIVLEEDHMAWTDNEYADIITDAIEEKTTNYQVCVQVETVMPEEDEWYCDTCVFDGTKDCLYHPHVPNCDAARSKPESEKK